MEVTEATMVAIALIMDTEAAIMEAADMTKKVTTEALEAAMMEVEEAVAVVSAVSAKEEAHATEVAALNEKLLHAASQYKKLDEQAKALKAAHDAAAHGIVPSFLRRESWGTAPSESRRMWPP